MNTWLTVNEAATVLEISDRAVRKNCKQGRYETRKERANGGDQYKILLTSLPVDAQRRYAEQYLGTLSRPTSGLSVVSPTTEEHSVAATAPIPFPSAATAPHLPEIRTEAEIQAEAYMRAPAWARKKADKYGVILNESAGIVGSELRRWIGDWNGKHPDFKTSYTCVLEARNIYNEQGICGLLAQYGKTKNNTKIDDEVFEVFKGLYLQESRPATRLCWRMTLALAGKPRGYTSQTFPSPSSFMRRLTAEVPEQAIYLARYGAKKHNRKYASFIDRDWSAVKAGQAWISDHAQIDVATVGKDGKVVFQWLTSWMDAKTSRLLGWFLHEDAPNSDHIFQAFFYAAAEHGIPDAIIIDNGKDYRCKDFAGGRIVNKTHKLSVDEKETTAKFNTCALTARLGIEVHFSLPYNAQAKTVERKHLLYKEYISKLMPGYRGGNVVEKPESLAADIKAGRILKAEEFQKIFDESVVAIDHLPSKGKTLCGLSPMQLWAAENPVKRVMSMDALRLFCMRTSGALTIGRNGVTDSKLGVIYWGEWMEPLKGSKVYARRDLKNYAEAWIFDAESDHFLGVATIAPTCSALVTDEVSKQKLADLMADKRRRMKNVRSYLKDLVRPAAALIPAAHADAAAMLGGADFEIKEHNVVRLANTEMDKVIVQQHEMLREGTNDLACIRPPDRPAKQRIVLFESDID
ncbi:MAG TPA: DNA-binding domain-containing protein [bacterium]|nr:DNA-binding domain-containing protein [bacterium]